MSVRWVDRPPKALYASGRNLKWHLLQYLKRSPPPPALRNRNAESSYHCSKLFEQRLEFASASLYANSFVPIITLLYTKKKTLIFLLILLTQPIRLYRIVSGFTEFMRHNFTIEFLVLINNLKKGRAGQG